MDTFLAANSASAENTFLAGNGEGSGSAVVAAAVEDNALPADGMETEEVEEDSGTNFGLQVNFNSIFQAVSEKASIGRIDEGTYTLLNNDLILKTFLFLVSESTESSSLPSESSGIFYDTKYTPPVSALSNNLLRNYIMTTNTISD